MEPYAQVTQVWAGGPNSLTDPDDQPVITLSKKKLVEFGGADLEKVNFTLQYDVTELKYAANASIALIFDESSLVSQTDLKGVQGVAIARFRMPFLPKHDNKKKIGTHKLTIVTKLRPRWTIWHMIDSVRSFMELRSVATSSTSRTVVLVE